MSEDPPAPGPAGRGTKRPPRRRARAGAPGRQDGEKGGTAGQEPGKAAAPREIGGPEGPEPTRYGDWEIKGRCVDF